MKRSFLLLTSYFLLPILVGCNSHPIEPLPHSVTIEQQTFKLIGIKKTEAERAQGLQKETNLKKNHGMWFKFPYSDNHGFWMKDTLIPLDIIWISSDMHVVAIKKNAPPCKTTKKHPDLCVMYIPDAKARYALEINAGTFEGQIGDRVTLEY